MIENVQIKNFKCFRSFRADGFKRINVIVGDNGAGKTAFLEAVFLALAGNVQVPLRYRTNRGLDGSVQGSARQIEEAAWGDMFYNMNSNEAISIILDGTGNEARSVSVSRGQRPVLLSFGSDSPSNGISTSDTVAAPIVFDWRDSHGGHHLYSASITSAGMQIPNQEEDLPDFYYFPSGTAVSSTENAARFSTLSKARRERHFIEMFTREYKWIEDLSIEVLGGAAVIHATVKGIEEKIPVTSISGAISRFMAILLTIASRPKGVVLVDEAEDGIYHTHHEGYWRALLSFCREFDCQMFLTTHNEEWLNALVAAAERRFEDIALWQMVRGTEGPEMFQFTGTKLKAAAEYGADLRGNASAE